jgi:hypothetical protein
MLDTTLTALSALTKAWAVTMTAVTLLTMAVALSQIWNGAVYLSGLKEALAVGM